MITRGNERKNMQMVSTAMRQGLPHLHAIQDYHHHTNAVATAAAKLEGGFWEGEPGAGDESFLLHDPPPVTDMVGADPNLRLHWILVGLSVVQPGLQKLTRLTFSSADPRLNGFTFDPMGSPEVDSSQNCCSQDKLAAPDARVTCKDGVPELLMHSILPFPCLCVPCLQYPSIDCLPSVTLRANSPRFRVFHLASFLSHLTVDANCRSGVFTFSSSSR